MITWSIPSYNIMDMLPHMDIEWPRRVYCKIVCIGEHRYKKVLQMSDGVAIVDHDGHEHS